MKPEDVGLVTAVLVCTVGHAAAHALHPGEEAFIYETKPTSALFLTAPRA